MRSTVAMVVGPHEPGPPRRGMPGRSALSVEVAYQRRHPAVYQRLRLDLRAADL
jgi:hypothetical protein